MFTHLNFSIDFGLQPVRYTTNWYSDRFYFIFYSHFMFWLLRQKEKKKRKTKNRTKTIAEFELVFIFQKSLVTSSLVFSFARHNFKRNQIWTFVSSFLWLGLHWSFWQMASTLKVCRQIWLYSMYNYDICDCDFCFFFVIFVGDKLKLFYVISESYYNVRLPPPGAHRKHGTHKAQVKRQPGVHQTRHPRQSQYLAQMRKPSSTSRTTGPVFTLVKTDPRANFRWGVRHFVGRKYA